MRLHFVKRSTAGFTLIELLVSLSLLSVVIVVAVGLLLTTNAEVKQSRAQRRVMDNVSFALEHMSRSITYGRDFSCFAGGIPASCPFSTGGTQTLSFSGTYLGLSTTITYERRINGSSGRGYISRSTGGGSFVPITDENIDIEELTFYVYHAEPFSVDPQQPRVTIAIRGVSYASKTPQPFFIQTTLSQRDLKL